MMRVVTQKTTLCRIIQISDTHIAADRNTHFDGTDTQQSLAAVLALIAEQEQDADLLLLTGDLACDPAVAAYERLSRLLHAVSLPIFCLAGNHDDPAMMRAHLRAANIYLNKSLSANNWSVLLLNTWQPGRPSGRLSRAEWQFLQGNLEHNRHDHMLLALHHHPLPCGSAWMDAMMLEDADALLALLADYPAVKALIWGHIHQEFAYDDGRCLYLGSPSTCAQFKPYTRRHERDALMPGYRVLNLHADGRITTTVNRLAGV